MQDCLSHIFTYLDINDIKTCSVVNKEYNKAYKSEYLWHILLERDYKDHYNIFLKSKKFETYKGCRVICEITQYDMEILVEEFNLIIYRKNLSYMPPEIGKLVNLEYLYLNENILTSIPAEIGNLINLTRLNLSNNMLTSIPPQIGNLINLEFFHLRNNSLTSVPTEISNMTKLIVLDLTDNPIIYIPLPVQKMASLKMASLKMVKIDYELAVNQI